jgi:hypothetical protein
MVLSILHPGCLRIVDGHTGSHYYGCDQEWFSSQWQRRAGCAACTASNLLLYNRCKNSADINSPGCKKEHCLELMHKVWEYVTPTMKGIPTTELFCSRLFKLAEPFDLKYRCKVLDFSEEKTGRPDESEIWSFFAKAFGLDVPVAFLNRCNGAEEKLDRWHWVTVFAVSRTAPGEDILASIADGGKIKNINFSLWSKTTTGGGGLVYFDFCKQ